ncbi:MAG TPA: glycerophosphodiester phosphodiesterase family protein [Acidimicrobiales bacterium]|nr:glycerophosphodiester phosphodiesterase family protein [Acidimicrobiales bacterium]
MFFARVKLHMWPKLSGYVAVQLSHHYGIENLPAAWRWIGRLVPKRLHRLTVLDTRMVDAAAECDAAVHAWTIDDEAEIKELTEMGVRGIMTDRPTVLTRV